MQVGISISESPDMEYLGFGDTHLHDFLTEVARYLLSAGASLAYGGDLRANGFTETLFSLVGTYKMPGQSHSARILSYLAWPIHLLLDVGERARLQNVAEIKELPAPAIEGIDPTVFLPPNELHASSIWCKSLTAMRRQLALDNDAQVLMGGRTAGYKGRYPGVVEEAHEFMKAGKPVYLIGAFGGGTRAVIEALRHGNPEVLTEKVQSGDVKYEGLVKYYNATTPDTEEQINYPSLRRFFHEKGVLGLNNALSAAENERLFTSHHLPEIISLILKGLTRVYAKNPGYHNKIQSDD